LVHQPLCCLLVLVPSWRDEAKLNRIGDECTRLLSADMRPLLVTGDMTVDSDVKRIVDATVEKFGCLNILVNSAGIIDYGTIETTPMEQFDHVMNVNVRSVCQLTKFCVPYLVQAQGSIVNVSSVVGVDHALQVLHIPCQSLPLISLHGALHLTLLPREFVLIVLIQAS